ncbi:MAG TPA: hypothetical protein VEL76_20925, partial [Gemmataceae bacterium]|nr:hypothetical protein [Gemmataceae bacterium]
MLGVLEVGEQGHRVRRCRRRLRQDRIGQAAELVQRRLQILRILVEGRQRTLFQGLTSAGQRLRRQGRGEFLGGVQTWPQRIVQA